MGRQMGPEPEDAGEAFDKNYEVTRRHGTSQESILKMSAVRGAAKQFLDVIDANCPACADSQFAKRLVRMAMMVANAAIDLDGMV
jgi:hypothetical protein